MEVSSGDDESSEQVGTREVYVTNNKLPGLEYISGFGSVVTVNRWRYLKYPFYVIVCTRYSEEPTPKLPVLPQVNQYPVRQKPPQ